MTPQEFIAWLDGYIEAGGEDFQRVKEQAAKISFFSTSPHITPTVTEGPFTLSSKCGCPPGVLCGNVACPNLPQITC